jgi:predicted transcriptional regulator
MVGNETISRPERPLERINCILKAMNGALKPTAELAHHLNITLSLLTRYFHVMEEKSLIRRKPNANLSQYQLTQQGQHFLEGYQRIQQLLSEQTSARMRGDISQAS